MYRFFMALFIVGFFAPACSSPQATEPAEPPVETFVEGAEAEAPTYDNDAFMADLEKSIDYCKESCDFGYQCFEKHTEDGTDYTPEICKKECEEEDVALYKELGMAEEDRESLQECTQIALKGWECALSLECEPWMEWQTASGMAKAGHAEDSPEHPCYEVNQAQAQACGAFMAKVEARKAEMAN